MNNPEPRMRPNETKAMKDCGFYIHYVPLSEDEPYANAHTHGVPETWGAGPCTLCGTEGGDLAINPACGGCRGTGKVDAQLDFQIVVAIAPDSAARIFWDLVDRVKEGERFKCGDRVHEILKQPILLRECPEGHPERGTVLRVLIPNSQVTPATLPGDEGHDPEFFPLQESLDTENLPWGDAPGHRDVPEREGR